jgi:hypothetical protein
MLSPQDTRAIPVDLIDLGQRRQTPSDAEIDHMVKSIEQDGLLVPIGVQRTGENSYRLVHGATRLSAVKKIGWQEISATILDGTEVDGASAEIVENLTRRHLDKDQRDELTRAYVELRSAQEPSGSSKELHDNVSHNSSHTPTSHPKTKVEGAKPGRPPTARGQAKKEVANLTGQSVRTAQRATKPADAASVAEAAAPPLHPEPEAGVSEFHQDQTSETARPRSGVKSGDGRVCNFTTTVCELVRLTQGRKAKDFTRTGVSPDDLATAGKLLTDLAELKRSGAAKPRPMGNGTESAAESGETRKKDNATLEEDESEGCVT